MDWGVRGVGPPVDTTSARGPRGLSDYRRRCIPTRKLASRRRRILPLRQNVDGCCASEVSPFRGRPAFQTHNVALSLVAAVSG